MKRPAKTLQQRRAKRLPVTTPRQDDVVSRYPAAPIASEGPLRHLRQLAESGVDGFDDAIRDSLDPVPIMPMSASAIAERHSHVLGLDCRVQEERR